jgi:hypothetical protein
MLSYRQQHPDTDVKDCLVSHGDTSLAFAYSGPSQLRVRDIWEELGDTEFENFSLPWKRLGLLELLGFYTHFAGNLQP